MAAENSNVKTTRRPTASIVEFRLPIDVNLYIAMTGKMSRTKIMNVMMMPTSFSIRVGE